MRGIHVGWKGGEMKVAWSIKLTPTHVDQHAYLLAIHVLQQTTWAHHSRTNFVCVILSLHAPTSSLSQSFELPPKYSFFTVFVLFSFIILHFLSSTAYHPRSTIRDSLIRWKLEIDPFILSLSTILTNYQALVDK